MVPVVEGNSDEKAAAAAATAVPDGTGEHRADTTGSTAVDTTDPDPVITETRVEVA